jgi:hypothetical protein
MIRALVLALMCVAPGAALAQGQPPCSDPAAAQSTHCMHMMAHGAMTAEGGAARAPKEPGQAAFAAIQEIVGILEADSNTDWSRVDIEALRQHLVDMNNVTLGARVKAVSVDGGMRFEATGDGPVVDSIRRMTAAHAAMMNGAGRWTYAAAEIDGGAALTVHVPPQDAAKLKALGFMGVMTLGMHHAMHHLMIAKGEAPHL